MAAPTPPRISTSLTDTTHPRLGGAVLRGRVYGHPDIEDGSRITTSHLAVIDGAGSEWARTMSRYYRLGRREEEALH